MVGHEVIEQSNGQGSHEKAIGHVKEIDSPMPGTKPDVLAIPKLDPVLHPQYTCLFRLLPLLWHGKSPMGMVTMNKQLGM